MYVDAIERLTLAGFEHYEVSNFAKVEHRCRHNLTYWLGEPYFAAGPGAASYIDGERRMNHRSTTTYLKRVLAGKSPIAETERLPAADRAKERLVFGLRMIDGVECDEFQVATGYDVDVLVGAELRQLMDLGLVTRTGSHLKLTRDGLLIADSVCGQLLG